MPFGFANSMNTSQIVIGARMPSVKFHIFLTKISSIVKSCSLFVSVCEGVNCLNMYSIHILVPQNIKLFLKLRV